MKSRTVSYLLILLFVVLAGTLFSVYTQNVRYRKLNRELLLENDSILSVNQQLHQLLNIEDENNTKSE